jgi:transposase-like protein
MSRANGSVDGDGGLEAADVVGDVDAAEFRQRQRAPSSTPDDERPRCPACDAFRVRTRGCGYNSPNERGHRCGNCGHTWTDRGAGK